MRKSKTRKTDKKNRARVSKDLKKKIRASRKEERPELFAKLSELCPNEKPTENISTRELKILIRAHKVIVKADEVLQEMKEVAQNEA